MSSVKRSLSDVVMYYQTWLCCTHWHTHDCKPDTDLMMSVIMEFSNTHFQDLHCYLLFSIPSETIHAGEGFNFNRAVNICIDITLTSKDLSEVTWPREKGGSYVCCTVLSVRLFSPFTTEFGLILVHVVLYLSFSSQENFLCLYSVMFKWNILRQTFSSAWVVSLVFHFFCW